MTLTVDPGWVTEASVEDVKLLPGVHRTMFRLQGGDWVAREIVRDVQSGRAELVISSGDVIWWGNQGLTVSESPYWQRVNDTILVAASRVQPITGPCQTLPPALTARVQVRPKLPSPLHSAAMLLS